jgi:hypothetical protein
MMSTAAMPSPAPKPAARAVSLDEEEVGSLELELDWRSPAGAVEEASALAGWAVLVLVAEEEESSVVEEEESLPSSVVEVPSLLRGCSVKGLEVGE